MRVPIVAMTANTIEGDRERCIAAGMDDYLPKPLRVEDLEIALGRALDADGDWLDAEIMDLFFEETSAQLDALNEAATRATPRRWRGWRTRSRARPPRWAPLGWPSSRPRSSRRPRPRRVYWMSFSALSS